MSKEYEQFVKYLKDNELEMILKNAVEKIVTDVARYFEIKDEQLKKRNTKLRKENEDLRKRLRVYEFTENMSQEQDERVD